MEGFMWGLIAGLFIGTPVGAVVMSLCAIAARSETMPRVTSTDGFLQIGDRAEIMPCVTTTDGSEQWWKK